MDIQLNCHFLPTQVFCVFGNWKTAVGICGFIVRIFAREHFLSKIFIVVAITKSVGKFCKSNLWKGNNRFQNWSSNVWELANTMNQEKNFVEGGLKEKPHQNVANLWEAAFLKEILTDWSCPQIFILDCPEIYWKHEILSFFLRSQKLKRRKMTNNTKFLDTSLWKKKMKEMATTRKEDCRKSCSAIIGFGQSHFAIVFWGPYLCTSQDHRQFWTPCSLHSCTGCPSKSAWSFSNSLFPHWKNCNRNGCHVHVSKHSRDIRWLFLKWFFEISHHCNTKM